MLSETQRLRKSKLFNALQLLKEYIIKHLKFDAHEDKISDTLRKIELTGDDWKLTWCLEGEIGLVASEELLFFGHYILEKSQTEIILNLLSMIYREQAEIREELTYRG